jgi:SAM-dependent methyltransferase
MGSARRAVATAAMGARLPYKRARLRALRDFNAYLRLACAGVLSRSGLAVALRTPGPAADLASRAGLVDAELTEGLLDLAVSLRLVRRRGDRFSLRPGLVQAIASGRASDLEGLAEEVVAYDGPIYAALEQHLRGLEPQPYDAALGDLVAKVSRISEPVQGPWIADLARRARPARVLDVGCGSGVYLEWIAQACPTAELVGIDLDAKAVEVAVELLGARASIRQADLMDLPVEPDAPWDLIVLSNNIYYWPVERRAGVLRRLRGLTNGAGTVVAITAVPTAMSVVRNLELVVRVSTGCDRLPTASELEADARSAGFADVDVRRLAPGLGLVALVARG